VLEAENLKNGLDELFGKQVVEVVRDRYPYTPWRWTWLDTVWTTDTIGSTTIGSSVQASFHEDRNTLDMKI